MKQSAAKTLGTAALGAAFVAAAAGSASAAAAPAAPDAAAALGAVSQALPVDQVASKLPAGGPEALKAGQDALGKSAPHVMPAGEGQDPVNGLLGGLPTKGLPTGGLPTGAVPGVGA
ncbi:ATP-binding protein [Streptomyces sp. NPDC087440]|uniref:ATP-binding protein n=1 Tax=Streptomyces sp. NPDC087440 TaxID=3365790 RepID=UPI0037F4F9FE